MKRIWTHTTPPREGAPAAGPRASSQAGPHPDKVEEVERRLAQLRASGALPAPPREAPRLATRRSAPPRREGSLPARPAPQGGAARAPAPDGQVFELTASDRIDLGADEEPLLLTAEPDEPGADEDGSFERVSRAPVRLRRVRLGDVLVQRGLITQEQLAEALATQRRTGERLGSALVSLGVISIKDMVSALAEQLGVEVILQDKVEIDPSARDVLPIDIIRRHEVVPLWANDKLLRIAMADPTNLAIIDEIRFRSGRWVQVVLAAEATVRALIAGTFASSSLMAEIMGDGGEEVDLEQVPVDVEEDKPNVYELLQESTGRPVVNFVNFLLTESVRRRASDVHVEPYETSFRIRFRVDGELQTIVSPPPRLHDPVISRIKVMAGLDLSRRRVPQDGHLAVRYAGQVLHYRVTLLPTVYGEKAALRLLTRDADLADLGRIGLPEDEERRLRQAIAAPQGLVLVTGQAGSGRTTTVHAALSALSDPARNVATLEDPVEVTLPGVNHVQVSEHGGVRFADGLRSLLRQDPDVVFVGELRDAEVATLAVRASLTGRLVLSTLPTSGAIEVFDRLDDIGVDRYLVAAAIQTVVAQRLLRRVCGRCAAPVRADELAADVPELEGALRRMSELGLPHTFQRGAGCDDCLQSGYRRRIGVYEVLPMDRPLRELLRRKARTEELAAALGERGFRTLYENGLRLAAQGLTTLGEVQRVLGTSG